VPPQVSVIITSYNYARFIGETIQSVLDQTYLDVEVIVVDDGSTDNTPEVLARFGDRITCIYQRNQGKSGALNRGIDAARGRYLAFVDSDDAWLPDALERRLAVFESDPGVGVVYGRTLVMDESGTLLPYMNGAPPRYPDDTLRSLLHGVFIPFLTFMARRTCLDQAGTYFNPDFGATNDWELYLRLSRACRFHFVDQPLARYRVHGSNWSGNSGVMAKQMARVVFQALNAPDLPPEIEASKHSILRNMYTNIGLGFVGPGPRRVALHYFARAIRVSHHPMWAVLRIPYLIIAGYGSHNPVGARLIAGIASLKEQLNYALAERTR